MAVKALGLRIRWHQVLTFIGDPDQTKRPPLQPLRSNCGAISSPQIQPSRGHLKMARCGPPFDRDRRNEHPDLMVVLATKYLGLNLFNFSSRQMQNFPDSISEQFILKGLLACYIIICMEDDTYGNIGMEGILQVFSKRQLVCGLVCEVSET
ncbi:hypothetical protein TNCV_2236351 [Trichonephila clavipes]|nr:hypothetical protein TNCV_2236351 [Trichonephila clavipes]